MGQAVVAETFFARQRAQKMVRDLPHSNLPHKADPFPQGVWTYAYPISIQAAQGGLT